MLIFTNGAEEKYHTIYVIIVAIGTLKWDHDITHIRLVGGGCLYQWSS